MRSNRAVLLAVGLALLAPSRAAAGMPSVQLSDVTSMRAQSISFFLMLFLVSALAVRWIWNSLAKDFPRLPRLSHPRALGLVGLWGALFVLVLTMISGARELMTPGAWKKDGLTYTLAAAPPPPGPEASGPTQEDRRLKLHALYRRLEAYAAGHDGRNPPPGASEIEPEWWTAPGPSGLRYVYLQGAALMGPYRLLACEPEVFADGRLVLFTSGEVKRLSSAEIAALLAEGR